MLILIALFLLTADVVMTYFAIKRFGIEAESNRIMRAVMKTGYGWVVMISALYGLAVWYFSSNDMIDVLGWVAILGLNGAIFTSNAIWYAKNWRRIWK